MKLLIIVVVSYLIGKIEGYSVGSDRSIFYYGPNEQKYDDAMFGVLTRPKGK